MHQVANSIFKIYNRNVIFYFYNFTFLCYRRSRNIIQKKDCILVRNIENIFKKTNVSCNGSKVKSARIPLTITCLSVSLFAKKKFPPDKVVSEKQQCIKQKASELNLDWRKLLNLLYADIWVWLGALMVRNFYCIDNYSFIYFC